MYKNRKTAVIIAAAGMGKRMGESIPKQYLKIGDRPILVKSIEAFERNPSVDYIFVVTNREYVDHCKALIASYCLDKVVSVISGGRHRQDSVYDALQEINRKKPGVQYVLVHDGARPFVTQGIIDNVIRAAFETGAAVSGVPLKDSVRQTDDTGKTSKTLKRDTLSAIQTPQGFKKSILVSAYEKAYADRFYGTDDAELVERTCQEIKIVNGAYENIKITTKEDMPMENRIGSGYDVHVLKEGRRLILGGIKIPFEKGLAGHSDADVLIHALMDALLGAAGKGDIGRHFPDTDEEYKDISSLILLERVGNILKKDGYKLGNADITVIAQKPKLSTYIRKMEENIAKVLETDKKQINIKATTTEGLGFAGREEGIAAYAVCSIYRH